MMPDMNKKRVIPVNKIKPENGNILYWMSRDQRVKDNWSLIYALRLGYKYKKKVYVAFNLTKSYLNASGYHYNFLLTGLNHIINELKILNIPFIILTGEPKYSIPKVIKDNDIKILISDFCPLKIKRNWHDYLAKHLQIPFYLVDNHNIVPYHITSDKQEFAAYTIRPKINKHLDEFLTEYPALERFQLNDKDEVEKLSNKSYQFLKDYNFLDHMSFTPGEKAASLTLKDFISNKLANYNELKNDPCLNNDSNLSPYIHFGHISSQRIALEVNRVEGYDESKKSFLEELIIRKELSDNFCYYNRDYDNFDGFPEWAKTTLNIHRDDERDYIYSLDDFEYAETHDVYWNAAQIQLLNTGKMHGYMRMYWAKKILEWSLSPEHAIEIAITLNDKYELDGRDPNGYTGIAWSIGGVHDRAWAERPVFGKIRYMNANGLKRKFDIEKYAEKYKKII